MLNIGVIVTTMPDIHDDLRDMIMTLNGRGAFAQLQQVCTTAIETARTDNDPESEAIALMGLVGAYAQRGHFTDAQTCLEQADAIAQGLQHTRLLVNVLSWQGYLYAFGQLRHHTGLTCYQEALTLIRTTGEADDEVSVLVNLGNMHMMLQQVDEARAAYQAALPIARASNNQREIIWATNGLALVDTFKHKDYKKAQAVFGRAISVAEENGYLVDACALWLNQGFVHLMNPHYYQRAVEDFLRALAIAEEIGHFNHRLLALHSIAGVHLKHGNEVRAHELFQQALDIARDRQSSAHEAQIHRQIAQVHYEAKNYRQAEEAAQQAQQLAQSCGNDELMMSIHITLGNIYYKMWRFNRARGCFRLGRDAMRQFGSEAAANQINSAMRVIAVMDIPFALLRLVGLRDA